MAEAARDHPGFRWIMEHLVLLARDFPLHWVVADHEGFVTARPDQALLLEELRDRVPNELAIVYIDPAIFRASPPSPRNPPPLVSGGGGGAVFEREMAGRAG